VAVTVIVKVCPLYETSDTSKLNLVGGSPPSRATVAALAGLPLSQVVATVITWLAATVQRGNPGVVQTGKVVRRSAPLDFPI